MATKIINAQFELDDKEDDSADVALDDGRLKVGMM
jgi:hypothetical protein